MLIPRMKIQYNTNSLYSDHITLVHFSVLPTFYSNTMSSVGDIQFYYILLSGKTKGQTLIKGPHRNMPEPLPLPQRMSFYFIITVFCSQIEIK
jgi:hypothetical protein